MSDVSNQEFKYLCAIIRKPQEGKTFICLENIKTNGQSYHLIITMNTIKSNLQFFERARAQFGEKICVFNSRGKKKEQRGGFLHAKSVPKVKKHLKNGAEVVIMCAHPKRFDESIIELLEEIEDSPRIKRNVIIHIDEAHSYVPPYREKIIEMNMNSVTERIYMYSATPFSIWCSEASVHKVEQLFKSIYVVDNEKEFRVKKSDKYFGVKDCEFSVVPQEYPRITPVIPKEFIERWGNKKQRDFVKLGFDVVWEQPGPFDIGNEVDLLSHTEHTLKMLSNSRIKDNEFSLNFVPGFCRKLTHYMIMEMILEIYPNALVILINGDGTQLFREEDEMKGGLSASSFKRNIVGSYIPLKNEPSEQIEDCIKEFPGRPTFVTGFHCVGMSVTFINERIGNFDNVIYSHEHYMERPDVHYQLCRFLFNYTSWSPEGQKKIKKTKLYLSCHDLLQNCLDYEKQIDKIDTELSGTMLNRSEVVGDMKVKMKKVPRERRFDPLEPYANIVGLKKFPVMDEEDAGEALNQMKKVYKEFMGKELKGKAMPKKNSEGLYECSTLKKDVHLNPLKMSKTLKDWKKTSNFTLKKNKRRYARVYVAYYDKENKNEYMWFLRMMELEDREEVERFWETQKDREE